MAFVEFVLKIYIKSFKQEIKQCVIQWMHLKYRICSLEYLFIYFFLFIKFYENTIASYWLSIIKRQSFVNIYK